MSTRERGEGVAPGERGGYGVEACRERRGRLWLGVDEGRGHGVVQLGLGGLGRERGQQCHAVDRQRGQRSWLAR